MRENTKQNIRHILQKLLFTTQNFIDKNCLPSFEESSSSSIIVRSSFRLFLVSELPNV